MSQNESEPDPKEQIQVLKRRLKEVIVGQSESEKESVMRTIRRLKPFVLEWDMDSSVANHFCLVLRDIAKDPVVDSTLILNLVRTINKLLPNCKSLNEKLFGSEGRKVVSLYDSLIPAIAAVLLRIPAPQFHTVEKLLLQMLLEEETSRSLVAMDVWCIICRAGEHMRLDHCSFLLQLALSLRPDSLRRVHILTLVERLMDFMGENEKQFILKKFDPVNSGLPFALKYLTEEQKQAAVNQLLDVIFGSESGRCILSQVHTACHLLSLVEKPHEASVMRMKQLVASFKGQKKDDASEQQVEFCMSLLDSI